MNQVASVESPLLSMQRKNRTREITIHDPRAAAVFTRSPLRRILLQFAAQPRNLAEVAGALGLDLKQLHHAVTKLCRLGLVEVVAEQARAGRAIKLYQCSSASYFIPTRVAPEPFSRGLAKELQEAIARDAAAALEGMAFTLDDQGRVAGRMVQRKGAKTAAPLDSWRILRLSAAQAQQLKEELGAVLDRWQGETDRKGAVYLVHTGMARRLDGSGATDNPGAD